MAEQTAQMAPPGWYRPEGEEGERYWDGTQWTEHRRPASEVAEAQPNAVESESAAQAVPVEPLFAEESEGTPAGPEPTVATTADATVAETTANVPAATADAMVSAETKPVAAYNAVAEVRYRRGWPGLFSGENQTKALSRSIAAVNASGLAVVATARDRWSFWRRLGSVLLAVVTVGFVVRAPNLLLITAPLPPDAHELS